MLHTEKCIKNRLASSGKAAARDHAAVWVPDNDAPKCMRCSGKFTVINRRVSNTLEKKGERIQNLGSVRDEVCQAFFGHFEKNSSRKKLKTNHSP